MNKENKSWIEILKVAEDGKEEVVGHIRDKIEMEVDRVEKPAKRRRPVDTGGFERMLKTGSVGCPIWLHELLNEAGVRYVRMIELGGRGVLTEAGWVSVDELREVAEQCDQ